MENASLILRHPIENLVPPYAALQRLARAIIKGYSTASLLKLLCAQHDIRSKLEEGVRYSLNDLYSVIAKYLFMINAYDCILAIGRRVPGIEADRVVATSVRTCKWDVAVFQCGVGQHSIAEDNYIQIIFLINAGISKQRQRSNLERRECISSYKTVE